MNILSRGIEVLRDGRDPAQACAGWETTARIAREVNGAVRPSAAGTLRGSASMRSPVRISGLQARKDAGKTQHRTLINLGRRDLLADALMELALQFEATHFAQMDHRCCCPSSCLADIAAAAVTLRYDPLLLC